MSIINDSTDGNNDTDESNFLDNLLENGKPEEIKEYLISTFTRKNGPKKSYKFYLLLAGLYNKYPDTAIELIETIPKWGYWKDYFILLLANKDPDLEEFIYKLIIDQLELDYDNYMNGNEISNLAKWIPKQSKSFDKKMHFVSKVCKIMYPNEPIATAKRKYRKMVSALNKHLGTTEIYLCSNDYSDIDFDKVPALCLKNNMKTFLKNEEARGKLQKHLFKTYIKLDYKGFLDKIVFRKPSEFEKGILRDVWLMNRLDFCDQIEKSIGVNPKSVDVVVDMSKSMYDSKLINIPIGVALLSSLFGNRIIVNANNPTVIDMSHNKYDIFDNIDKISQESAYFEHINFEKIFANDLVKKKKLLVITNKRPQIPESYAGNPTITYWVVSTGTSEILTDDFTEGVEVKYGNMYEVKNVRNERLLKNKKSIKNVLDNSQELGKLNFTQKICRYFIGAIVTIAVGIVITVPFDL